MQRLSALFILALIITQAFYNLGVAAYWVANHSYIAQVLCENRDKPSLKCDGKCYLRKHLDTVPKDSAPNGQNQPKSEKKGFEISEFILENSWFELNPIFFNPQLIPTIPGCCSVEPAARIFRPPIALVA